ncbi:MULTISPECIES: helix-turn-helix transcriptional regulator [unclassified Streptomyces]|uniref:helix-turn-helix transcriptional regulator n=1 Tax=unclassified Streptomyces TaxID=2593676 RepID=UPI0033326C26
MTAEPHSHAPGELCDVGSELYIRALRENRVASQDAEPAPCLVDFGLLYPDESDPQWLKPRAPAVALPQLLATAAERVADHRRREARLAAAFEPLMTIRTGTVPAAHDSAITVLRSFAEINEAIDRAVEATSEEVLTIQPGGARPADLLPNAVPPEQSMLTRGARMRTLYQHTTRHSLATLAHFEQLDGDVEVRTLDEVTDRLLVFDRTVAFIPATTDRSIALELRHPAVIDFLVTTFHSLWRLATPMFPNTEPQPTKNGITARQRAIATLLIEGLTDTEIATRLGMNVRTARVHIAKLATTLGSESRAQLGYLIGQSGILDR